LEEDVEELRSPMAKLEAALGRKVEATTAAPEEGTSRRKASGV
jgi:hypothetical protein